MLLMRIRYNPATVKKSLASAKVGKYVSPIIVSPVGGGRTGSVAERLKGFVLIYI
jgi:hypothetical protein